MKGRLLMSITLIVGILAVIGLAVGPIMSQVETPNYRVVEKIEAVEYRRYPPISVAEVVVEGSREEAIGNGFRLLADYIFGNNSERQEISMTAPVMQQSDLGTRDSEPLEPQDKASWRVNFVMPSQYQLDQLPNPANSKVLLSVRAESVYAVVTFSGKATTDLLQQQTEDLLAHLASRSIPVKSQPVYAFYNPPWTLPMLRRNEVMVEIDAPSDLN